MDSPDVILLAGPTASGKSRLAIELAERFGGIVINADSMQVYRDLSILTSRPSAADMQAVPHRMYGFVAADDAYSVGRWLADISVELSGPGLPIITGGTGLYFKALLEGLSAIPEIPADIRIHWRKCLADEGVQKLYETLQERDPQMALRLQPGDAQRIVRSLEVLDATGCSLLVWQNAPKKPVLSGRGIKKIKLKPERKELYQRCNMRFDKMLENGAIKEVASLLELDLSPDQPVMRALGVHSLAAYISGELTLDAAVEKAKTETRQYAKRQLTWARNNMPDWEEQGS
jgi:tRNA dimethylallyltransferase